MNAAKALNTQDHALATSVRMSNEDYHKRPELSNSQNNILVDETPAHFMERLKNPKPQTESMRKGEIIHALTLEPDRFLDIATVMPVFEGRTKDGKISTSASCKEVAEKREQFLVENGHKMILDTEDYHQAFGMIGSIMAHPKARELLRKNHNELSFFGRLEGVAARCRPDIVREGNLLADLKTTECANLRKFQKSIMDYHYHRQAAWYCDLVAQVTGQKYDTLTFIAVEKNPPYAVAVWVLDEASIEKGREEYKRGLELYLKCMAENKWPAYSEQVEPINLPSWAW